jgi:hypothetical protein
VVVKLNKKGVAQIAKSQEMAALMNATAARVAAAVDSDEPVETDEYTTDRRAAGVTLASERGETEEAVAGTLKRAAASVGLEVTLR